jgi:hypothetical protein
MLPLPRWLRRGIGGVLALFVRVGVAVARVLAAALQLLRWALAPKPLSPAPRDERDGRRAPLGSWPLVLAALRVLVWCTHLPLVGPLACRAVNATIVMFVKRHMHGRRTTFAPKLLPPAAQRRAAV